MIKINKLLSVWKNAEYDKESVTIEYKKLYYAIQSLYENAMITREKRDEEHAKLEVVYHKALNTLGKQSKVNNKEGRF